MSAIDRAAAVMAGEAGPTVCRQCKHMQAAGPTAPAWTWLCNANPIDQVFSYLTGEFEGAPYRLCKHINAGGNCPQYEEGINTLSPPKLVPDGHGGMVLPTEGKNDE